MIKKACIYLTFCLFSSLLVAREDSKTIPIVVNIDSTTSDNFPPAYFVAQNHYTFRSKRFIKSVSVSDSLFTIDEEDKNHYIIDWDRSSIRLHKFGDIASIKLKFTFNDMTAKEISVRYIFFPPVRIIFIDSTNTEIVFTNKQSNYAGTIRAYAEWQLPAYAQMFLLIKGYFGIDFFCKDKKINKLTGWNDTGDRTRVLDLGQYSNCPAIRAVICSDDITTLYPKCYGINSSGHLHLADDTPKEVEFIMTPSQSTRSK